MRRKKVQEEVSTKIRVRWNNYDRLQDMTSYGETMDDTIGTLLDFWEEHHKDV